MAADFPHLSGSRRCAKTGREFKAGEPYVGVLIDEGGGLSRHDFGPESWTGPPADAIGYWTGRVPAGDGPARLPVDDEVVLECFRRTDDAIEPGRIAFRYVLALLLMRKRCLRLEDSRRDEAGEVLALRAAKGGERFEVRDPGLTESQLAETQVEVFRLLGWE